MAWLTRTNWVNTEKPVANDLNNIGLDIRTWGDNVNAGGYGLSNLSALSMLKSGGSGAIELAVIACASGSAGDGPAIKLKDSTTSLAGQISTYKTGTNIADLILSYANTSYVEGARVGVKGFIVGGSSGLASLLNARGGSTQNAAVAFNMYTDVTTDKALTTGNRSGYVEVGNAGITLAITPNTQTIDTALSGLTQAILVATDAKVMIGTGSPSISGTGVLHHGGNTLRFAGASRTISASGDSGNAGEMCYDDTYLYVRQSSGWRRVALGSAF